jgi:hypothetical protein
MTRQNLPPEAVSPLPEPRPSDPNQAFIQYFQLLDLMKAHGMGFA